MNIDDWFGYRHSQSIRIYLQALDHIRMDRRVEICTSMSAAKSHNAWGYRGFSIECLRQGACQAAYACASYRQSYVWALLYCNQPHTLINYSHQHSYTTKTLQALKRPIEHTFETQLMPEPAIGRCVNLDNNDNKWSEYDCRLPSWNHRTNKCISYDMDWNLFSFDIELPMRSICCAFQKRALFSICALHPTILLDFRSRNLLTIATHSFLPKQQPQQQYPIKCLCRT